MNIRKWNGVPVSENRIHEWRQEAFEYLRDNPTDHFWYTMSGDSMVFGIREDTCISIYHTKVQDSTYLTAAVRTVWEDMHDTETPEDVVARNKASDEFRRRMTVVNDELNDAVDRMYAERDRLNTRNNDDMYDDLPF